MLDYVHRFIYVVIPMDCLYHETYHLFVGKTYTDRTITLQCKECILSLPDAEILILKQNSPTLCRANEIGDDMEIICLYERMPFLLETVLDNSIVIETMSLYKEYSEETGEQTTYLYWFTKQQALRESVQQFLTSAWIDARITQKNRFFILEHEKGEDIAIPYPTQKDKKTKLSRLIWLLLAYGDGYTASESGDLYTWFVHIPLVGTIAPYQWRILDLLADLGTTLGLFFTTRIVPMKIGTMIEITIRDREVLTLLHSIHHGLFQSVSRTLHYTMLLAQITQLTHTTDRFQEWKTVLKLIRK